MQIALDRVSIDKTTLVIAHKLATVRTADNIVVMSYGRVMEQGTHQALIDKDGQYAALVRAQDLGGGGDRPDFSKEEADVEMEENDHAATDEDRNQICARTDRDRSSHRWHCRYGTIAMRLLDVDGAGRINPMVVHRRHFLSHRRRNLPGSSVAVLSPD